MENTRPLHTHTYLARCRVLRQCMVEVHAIGCGKRQHCITDTEECPHFFMFTTYDVDYPTVKCDHREPQTQGIVKSTSFGHPTTSIEVD